MVTDGPPLISVQNLLLLCSNSIVPPAYSFSKCSRWSAYYNTSTSFMSLTQDLCLIHNYHMPNHLNILTFAQHATTSPHTSLPPPDYSHDPYSDSSDIPKHPINTTKQYTYQSFSPTGKNNKSYVKLIHFSNLGQWSPVYHHSPTRVLLPALESMESKRHTSYRSYSMNIYVQNN